MNNGISRRTATLVLSLACGVGAAYAAEIDEKKKKGEVPKGVPMLWQDPGDVASRDLTWGSGSEAGAPKPPFRFVEEDTSGTNPKVTVTDAAGVTWSVKFDEEVHAEVAATRLAWALGYAVDETYFVASGRLEGASRLSRSAKFVRDGSFTNARFEKRPETVTRRGVEWQWSSNPFVGTKEYSGLIILQSLLSNWDTKDSNNEILAVRHDDGRVEDWYVVSDWGGTFGKMGGFGSHSKWDLEDYRKQQFISKVSDGRLVLDYRGKGGETLKSVPVEHARWFAGLASQLTAEQLRAAFRAAGASAAEQEGFAAELAERIRELEAAVGSDVATSAGEP